MENSKAGSTTRTSTRLRRGNNVPTSVKTPPKLSVQVESPTTDTTNLYHHINTPTEYLLPNGNHHQHNNHRHKSIPPSPAPIQQSKQPTSPSAVDYELISLKSPSYISLRDILPSSPSIMSPSTTTVLFSTAVASSSTSPSGGNIVAANSLSGCEISIRNRLVKQAAWAYLQPMSASPSSSGRTFWSRSQWWCLSVESVEQFFRSVKECVFGLTTRVFGWLADALWLVFCR